MGENKWESGKIKRLEQGKEMEGGGTVRWVIKKSCNTIDTQQQKGNWGSFYDTESGRESQRDALVDKNVFMRYRLLKRWHRRQEGESKRQSYWKVIQEGPSQRWEGEDMGFLHWESQVGNVRQICVDA